MTIFEEIDRMFLDNDHDSNCNTKQILSELRDIKTIVQDIKILLNKKDRGRRKKSREYYRFVEALREKLYADIDKGIYPEISYDGRKLGVDAKGMIYDKSTQHLLPTYEAFEVYDFLYENRKDLADYIKI